jgi:hypothetical protein
MSSLFFPWEGYQPIRKPPFFEDQFVFLSLAFLLTLLEAAEMRFLRIVKGYKRLDKIRNEMIRKELQICGIQDVRSKYKQTWINHLERMDNTGLQKCTLKCKPRGRRESGRPKKRWQCVDTGTGQKT